MVYVLINSEGYIYKTYSDLHLVPEHERDSVIEAELPEIPYQIGKSGVLKWNGVSFDLEYVDRPLTTEEELQKLKQQQELLQFALDDVILNGGV